MLVRIVAENILSFGEEREFNMLPSSRQTKLSHHIYKQDNNELLKLSAIYGANAAGKSNLIQVLDLLQDLVLEEVKPSDLYSSKYKFSEENTPIIIAIEFINKGKSFIYGIEILGNKVLTEELYHASMNNKEDELIFERKTLSNNKAKLNFSKEFEKDTENQTLIKVLENSLVEPDKLILKFLKRLDNKFLTDVNIALDWFEKKLQIIFPTSRPSGLPHSIDTNVKFKNYANSILQSFDLGINSIKVDKKTLVDFFGEDDKDSITKILQLFENAPEGAGTLLEKLGGVVAVKEEGGSIFVKKIQLEHYGLNKVSYIFEKNEESDGTIRLLDLIPLFYSLLYEDKVFIVDEVERSIHPLLIKELIGKFSKNKNSKGQFIFTTHESNLLDQNILRQDEIWFAEKDLNGCTDFYPLSDFKEHHTKNIRKGYLNGRYGGIPFLGNLKELNWDQYATSE